MRALAACVALCAALGAGCGGEEPTDPNAVFIALTGNFRGFQRWTRVDVGSTPLAGHPAGPRFVYANHAPPSAGSAYPVGTILVKTVESSADPTRWDIFAMVKRGGGFNADGARGWEFFRLVMTSDGVPAISGRGVDPDGGEYNNPGATPVADAGEVRCNDCHGSAAAGTDHVLSHALQPGH